MIKAEIVADSIYKGKRLTSFLLTYPRFIHSEFMTHRCISKNSSSCLAGDSIIHVIKPYSIKSGKMTTSNNLTIKDLYNKWKNGDSRGRSLRHRLKNLNLKCLNEDTNIFQSTKLVDVVYSGIKDIYEIELTNGFKLKCTKEHRLFTDNGWKTLNDLNIQTINDKTVYDNPFFKIATNGLDISKELIETERDVYNLNLKQIALKYNLNYKPLSYFTQKNNIKFSNHIKTENETFEYKNKDWLEARLKEGLFFTDIAKLCNSTYDKVKHSARKLKIKGNKFVWSNRPIWNKGKRYKLSENSLVNIRLSAQKRRKYNSYLNYNNKDSKRVRWLNEIRLTIMNKFNYKCVISGSNKKLQLHHIDPVWHNKESEFDIENIVPLNKEIHKLIHSKNLDLLFLEWHKSGKDLSEFMNAHSDIEIKCIDINKPVGTKKTYMSKFLDIKNITYKGKEETYDLEVEGPYHNFVANGIVVHNSRAIPVKKIIEDIKQNPALPIHWGKSQRGMQADNEVEESIKQISIDIWLDTMNYTISNVYKMVENGIHKQVANRLLEPFMHMKVLATGTDWDNLFALRYHKDAQPEFRELARYMIYAYVVNKPKKLALGEWHIPFGDKFIDGLTIEQTLKIATARSARLSYMTFNNEINYEDDYKLHDTLFESGHMSPFEHCAKAHDSYEYFGNFKGWLPYRKTFPKTVECKSFDYDLFCKENNIELAYD